MSMRLLRGLAGKALTCGCLVGTYETYDGDIVTTIDARSPRCTDPRHRVHALVGESFDEAPAPADTMHVGHRPY